MVESLKLSITDQQLPMFIRILQLIIALYYGEIGGHKQGDGEEGTGHVREAGSTLPGEWGLFGAQWQDLIASLNSGLLHFIWNVYGRYTKYLLERQRMLNPPALMLNFTKMALV